MEITSIPMEPNSPVSDLKCRYFTSKPVAAFESLSVPFIHLRECLSPVVLISLLHLGHS